MKKFNVTVNGTAYEVTVEETGSVSAPAAAPKAAGSGADRPSSARARRRPAAGRNYKHAYIVPWSTSFPWVAGSLPGFGSIVAQLCRKTAKNRKSSELFQER